MLLLLLGAGVVLYPRLTTALSPLVSLFINFESLIVTLTFLESLYAPPKSIKSSVLDLVNLFCTVELLISSLSPSCPPITTTPYLL